MVKNYSIEVVDGVSVTRFSQKAALSEIINAMDDVSAIGVFKRRLWIFHDGVVNLSTGEIRKIAEHGVKIWAAPSKAAIVVPDSLSFGLARMHDAFRDEKGGETRVFRTEQEAIAWLEEADDVVTP